MDSRQIQDARYAMIQARRAMDEYLEIRTANPGEFERLHQAVKLTTEEYARLVKEHLQQKYPFLGNPAPKPPEPQFP